MRKFMLYLLLLGVTACGGSDSSSSASNVSSGEEAIISGTVAMGLAIEGGVVTFTDKEGNEVTPSAEVVTDALGHYSATFGETFSVPLLVTITSSAGILKTIIDDVTQEVVNVNPVTNFVAEKVISDVGLSNVTSGTFNEEGTAIVEAAFGGGVDFSAFSTSIFVAQTEDNSAVPSPADVLLDALGDSAETNGVNALLEEAIEMQEPLLERVQFQVEVAKIASNTTLAEPLSSLVTSENADTAQALSNIDSFTDVIEVKKANIEADLASSELSAAEQEGIVLQVLDMAAELIDSSDYELSTAELTQILDNTDTLFTDELVTAVNNTEETITDKQMQQIIADVGNKIVDVSQGADIDFTTTEVIELPTEVIDEIADTVASPKVIVESARWDNANWDVLTWQ